MSSSIWKSILSAAILFGLFYPLISWKADENTESVAVEHVSTPPAVVAATPTDNPAPRPTYKSVKVAQKQVAPSPRTMERPTTDAALLFPVDDHDLDAIISVYGDPRSGGKRQHEGVDIKAPRGTPVVAVLDGEITRVKEGGGGGKQVWLATDGGLTFFYAHLDSWSVAEGDWVEQGDELGTVGNTGNASHTLPHLHFGIYTGRRKTTDPMPYLDPALMTE